MVKKEESQTPRTSYTVIIVCIVLAMVVVIGGIIGVVLMASSASSLSWSSGTIAVIPVSGLITTASSYGFSSDVANSAQIVEWIESAEGDSSISAVIFEIDSPGGTPVATDEIVQAMKKMGKPKVAVIREIGASGAYWVASASDRIFANRMAIVGSIGVVASYVEFAGFLKDHNMTYQRLVAGKYKDAGSPWKELTGDERKLFQEILDELHEMFIQDVAVNRHMPVGKVRELATGFVYLGVDGVKNGLVDELGDRDDAVAYLEKQLNISASVYEYQSQKSFFEELGAVMYGASFGFGSGVSSSLKEDASAPKVFV